MQLGEAWARPLETTWYVQTAERARRARKPAASHLDSEDGLLIQRVEEASAVLLNTALRWFRRRHRDEATNVVAFPANEMPQARAA